MSYIWTPERRELQRQVCLNNKIWEKSTGPKSPDGKKKVSKNAYKNGTRAIKDLMAEYNRLVKMSKDLLT